MTRTFSTLDSPVGGDDDLGLGVGDPGEQGLGGEAAEDDRVGRADPGAGQQCDDGLGDHRQVDHHRVALADAEVRQRIGGLLHLAVQVGIGDGARVAGFADEVDGHLVAAPRRDVPVQAVV
jgi:hypothetical protein